VPSWTTISMSHSWLHSLSTTSIGNIEEICKMVLIGTFLLQILFSLENEVQQFQNYSTLFTRKKLVVFALYMLGKHKIIHACLLF
jgi:hypothetical protein